MVAAVVVATTMVPAEVAAPKVAAKLEGMALLAEAVAKPVVKLGVEGTAPRVGALRSLLVAV